MFKRKFRSNSSKKKVKVPQGVSRMTVHQRNESSRETRFTAVTPTTIKPNWAQMDNDSSSWDRNSRATSSSWPGEMEEAATRKILQLWAAIDRNIYGEIDESSLERTNEECNQWKSQLVHLRIIGKSPANDESIANRESNETHRSLSRRSGINDDRYGEEIIMEDTRSKSRELSEKSRDERLFEKQREVFAQILEHVCVELFGKENETEETENLANDLDEVLRITPAPTYSGRKWTNDRKYRDNGDSRKNSANDKSTRDKITDPLGPDSTEKPRMEINDDADVDETPQVARNKLGTVFNEKIVVSPVPFVVSTRESFTTLRTTPISFRAQNFEFSTPRGFGRYMNSAASKTNSSRGMATLRVPQSKSAWQAPVCPTVWPKNIRLAPIDPSRLPSSKNRSSIDSMAGLPNRNRNSLSPITRPIKPITSANQRNNSGEGLEIQGRQIVARSSKKNLHKTGWECSPKNSRNSRTKTRITKR